MQSGPLWGDKRGVTEILGAILIFSLVLITALIVVGIGFNTVSDTTTEVDDQVGQDSITLLDDRIDSLSSSTADTGTSLTIPDNTGENFNANLTDAVVNVTVRTNDTAEDGGDLTPGDIAADELANYTRVPIGTVRHETSEGVETVYQGGMLFQVEDGYTRINSETGFDYDGRNIDFSFIGLSELQHIGDNQELIAERDTAATESYNREIEEMILAQRTLGGGVDDPDGFTNIWVNTTIETDYPGVWETYATERMTQQPDEIDVQSDQITLSFGEIEGNSTEPPEFSPQVIYSGAQESAHIYYNDTLGTVENLTSQNGFEITGVDGSDSATNILQDKYGAAVADDGIWKVAKVDNGPGPGPNVEWVDVSGDTVSEPDDFDASASDLGNTGGNNDDQWVFYDDATVCLVNPDPGDSSANPPQNDVTEIRHIVAEGDCQQGIVDTEPSETPDQQPLYELTVDSPAPNTDVNTGDTVTFDVTVENNGTAYDEQLVYLAGDLFGEGVTISDYEQVALYPGETQNINLNVTVSSEFNDTQDMIVSPENESQAVSVPLNRLNDPNFQIDNINGLDPGVAPGQSYDVEAEINNTGGDDEQIVVLKRGGNVVDTQSLDLATNGNGVVDLTWNVPLDASVDSGATLTVETEDDTDSLSVPRQPQALIKNIDVTVDNSANDVTADITVENPSSVTLTDTTVSVDASTSDLITSDRSTTIDLSNQQTVNFNWNLDSDGITDWVTAETVNETADDVGIVERSGPSCPVSYDDGDGSPGDPYEISNVDQLQCIEDDLNANYVLTEDVAAHGTEYWNGGDGFNPIGDEDSSGTGGDAFSAEFDGQGHRIVGLTIDRYDQAYVGLFAITNYFAGDTGTIGTGSEIKDLVMEDIYVRGQTVVGGVAGGGGGTFSRISVDGYVESQYQQVGGIVGHAHDADMRNELVSTATVEGNSLVMLDGKSHPWNNGTGSPNLGIGGILGGMGYETEISTAYSRADVRGQSSVGGIAGWTSNFDSTLFQMYHADGNVELEGNPEALEGTNTGRSPKSGDTSDVEAGGISGRIGEGATDEIRDSVYSPGTTVGDTSGSDANDNSISVAESDMVGPQVLPEGKPDSFYDQFPGVDESDAEGTMENLDFENTWAPVYDIDENGNIISEGYPVFQWQVSGDLIVNIDSVDGPVTPGADGGAGILNFTVSVENPSDEPQDETLVLINPYDEVVDSDTFTMGPTSERTRTLRWETGQEDRLNSDLDDQLFRVRGVDTTDTETVDLNALPEESVSIDSVSSNDTVRALSDEVVVEADISAEGSLSDLNGERVGLRVNGALVAIEDSLSGATDNVTLRWRPSASDTGNIDLEVDVLNRDADADEDVEVLQVVEEFEPGDDAPIDIDLDIISIN